MGKSKKIKLYDLQLGEGSEDILFEVSKTVTTLSPLIQTYKEYILGEDSPVDNATTASPTTTACPTTTSSPTSSAPTSSTPTTSSPTATPTAAPTVTPTTSQYTLKEYVVDNIYSNGQGKITAQIVQNALVNMYDYYKSAANYEYYIINPNVTPSPATETFKFSDYIDINAFSTVAPQVQLFELNGEQYLGMEVVEEETITLKNNIDLDTLDTYELRHLHFTCDNEDYIGMDVVNEN